MLSNKSLKLWTFFVLYVLSKGYLIVRRLIDTDREIKNTNTDPQCNVQSRGQIHFSLCLLVKNKSEPTKSSSPSNQQIIITLRKTVLKANLTVRRFLKPFFKGIVLKLVIGLVRLESLRPGFVGSRFESLIPGFVMGWLHIQTTQAEAVYLHWLYVQPPHEGICTSLTQSNNVSIRSLNGGCRFQVYD